MQNSDAWSVLLEHLLLLSKGNTASVPLDHIACKLLACSNAMASLVHSAWAGQLTVGLVPGYQPSASKAAASTANQKLVQQMEGAGMWLAKNARLLHCLYVSNPQLSDDLPIHDQPIAQGLAAAAKPQRRRTRSAASRFAAAAAAAAVPAGGAGQQGLLLQDCLLFHPSDRILCSLAGCLELSYLLWVPGEKSSLRACKRALASLSGLLHLVILPSSDSRVELRHVASALQHLTALTNLEVGDDEMDQRSLSYLPSSLRTLRTARKSSPDGDSLDFRHLTALTCMWISVLDPADHLPACMRELHLSVVPALQPVLQLQEMETLVLRTFPSASQLESLRRLSSLRSLRLAHLVPRSMAFHRSEPPDLAGAAAHLPALPVTHVELANISFVAAALDQLHEWTQLELLQLQGCYIQGSISKLFLQLQKLPKLQQLQLWSLTDSAAAGGVVRNVASIQEYEACLKGVAAMSSLRKLTLGGLPLYAAAKQLLSATQLSALTLDKCEVDSTTTAALKAGLAAEVQVHVGIARVAFEPESEVEIITDDGYMMAESEEEEEWWSDGSD